MVIIVFEWIFCPQSTEIKRLCRHSPRVKAVDYQTPSINHNCRERRREWSGRGAKNNRRLCEERVYSWLVSNERSGPL